MNTTSSPAWLRWYIFKYLHTCYNYDSRAHKFCFILSLPHFLTPPDINECASDVLNECHEYAMCVNTTGSYDCTCIAGYGGDGFNCTGTLTPSVHV